MTRARANGEGFRWVKRILTPAEADSLKQFKFDWLDLRREDRRVYLHGTLAAGAIGFTRNEMLPGGRIETKGLGGIELAHQAALSGQAGTLRMVTDAAQRRVDTLHVKDAVQGASITLTLDRRLQYYCDKKLREQVMANDCTSGVAVIMEPASGEVLAMSSFPTFDPNEPVDDDETLARTANRAISWPVEIGSVAKLFSYATALETTRLRPESPSVNCNGPLQIGDHTVTDEHPYGWLPMRSAFWHSSNICTVRIARLAGPDALHEYLRKFGFGERTGVRLPREDAGQFPADDKWSSRHSTHEFAAFGYGFSATAMQLARATSVIANGGSLVTPRIVRFIDRGSGRETPPVRPGVRVLRPETAVDMRTMAEGVVLFGTGKKAAVPGFLAGGKTGTAKRLVKQKGKTGKPVYIKSYNASFVGFAPVNRPELVVVVTLHGSAKMATAVAAPLFGDLMGHALRVRGVRPIEMPAPKHAPPAEEKGRMLTAAAPNPDDGEPAQAAAIVIGPKIPDFRGMDKQQVLRSALDLGLPVEMAGKGLVRSQLPQPGRMLAAGQRIRVQLAR